MRFDGLNHCLMARLFALMSLCFCPVAQARPSYQPPPLAEAAGRGDIKTIQHLVRQHPEWVAKGAEEGTRALIVAAGLGSKDGVALLLTCGLDVNGRDKFGNLPLVWAIRSSQTDMVKQLVAAGAD